MAGWTFWSLGPKARSAMSDLDRALDGPDKALRVMAGDALLRIDRKAARARVIAALAPLVTDKTIRLEHFRLIRVLIDAQGEERTAAMLIPLLKNPDLEIKLQAVYDLTMQVSRAKVLKPVMIEALASADGGMRAEAAFFVLKHEPAMEARAIDVLAGQIADPLAGSHVSWELIRRTRAASSASVKPLASKLVELLGRATKRTARTNIIKALGEVGAEAVSAKPALLELSESSDPRIATRALAALVKIDPRGTETKVPSLVEWIKPGHDSAVRLSAMASLRDLGPVAATAIPALFERGGRR